VASYFFLLKWNSPTEKLKRRVESKMRNLTESPSSTPNFSIIHTVLLSSAISKNIRGLVASNRRVTQSFFLRHCNFGSTICPTILSGNPVIPSKITEWIRETIPEFPVFHNPRLVRKSLLTLRNLLIESCIGYGFLYEGQRRSVFGHYTGWGGILTEPNESQLSTTMKMMKTLSFIQQ